MTKVLLLTGRRSDYQTERTTDAIVRGMGKDFTVTAGFIGADLRDGLTAVRWVRRHAKQVDAVHAFGTDALTAAAMGFDGPIIFTPTEFPTRRALRWTRAVSAYRNVQAVATTSTQHRAMIVGGLADERYHLIRPGVDFSKIRRRRDDALRAQLNFGPDDFVILLNGESTRAADHERAVWAGSILHVLDPHVRLLIWGQGPRGQRVARYARTMPRPTFASVAVERLGAEVSYEALLPATDCVLVTAGAPVPTLPIAVAMAAALPIVSTVTYTVAELLEDRHTALMATNPTPREIARRVRDLRDDSRTQWHIAETARGEAYAHFSLSHMVQQYRTLYRQLAGGAPVDLTSPPPAPVAR
ncbi:MAG TPA: glycosyltransferase [Tepidisphaeraceae bacterium]|jgi:glycosyltransferase involved in cell wall biosynthesis|nr:glycosyltransferase [Tepidisphaeraceae bacterium]